MIKSRGQKIFNVCNIVVMSAMVLVFFVPYWLIFINSFAQETAILQYGVKLFPKHFSLSAYAYVFEPKNNVVRAFGNSVFMTLIGTALAVLVCTLCAYPLSREKFCARKIVNVYLVVTLLFSGGLVPYFLIVTSLLGYNNLWTIIVPGLVNAWNIMLLRNFFLNIPKSLDDAAKIDGAGHMRVFVSVVLPLSLPILATVSLFSLVGFWNNWFGPMLFIDAYEKVEPIQSIVRRLMSSSLSNGGMGSETVKPVESVKFATVTVSTLPIILAYPLLQRYFISGMTAGSVKE